MNSAILLDENVSERLILLLVLLGYDVTSVGRLGWKGRNDAEHLIAATTVGRVVVTYDAEDYELLHHAWRVWSMAWNLDPLPQHPGILTIRPANGMTLPAVADAIDAVMRSESSLENSLFLWTLQNGWQELQ